MALTTGFAALLFVGLDAMHGLRYMSVSAWLLICTAWSIVMFRYQFPADQKLVVRLLQLVGGVSALYSLLHYPLMPVISGGGLWYTALLGFWIASVGAGIGCWKFPSLAIIPPAFLVWSKLAARQVTGLDHAALLDVAPLAEVAICAALGLTLARFASTFSQTERFTFAKITLVFAIGLHLANYYLSFVAKILVDGPLFSWARDNNPLNMYLAALDNGNVFFVDHAMSAVVGDGLNATYLLSNSSVFIAQALAAVAFFLPKRALIGLLIFYDIMHVAIALIAGANFWPWILLNLAIAAIVASPAYRQPPLPLASLGALFIVFASQVADVARLGWFDSGANNRVLLLAEDDTGKRHTVSTNFFTFYSYPIAHLSYGLPEPDNALNVQTPNGGTFDLSVLRHAQNCNVEALKGFPKNLTPAIHPKFDGFIRIYHEMARNIEANIGVFPYNIYPHHFHHIPASPNSFERLDKYRVVAYIYRRESACLSWQNGQLQRKIVSTGEHRIPIRHAP